MTPYNPPDIVLPAIKTPDIPNPSAPLPPSLESHTAPVQVETTIQSENKVFSSETTPDSSSAVNPTVLPLPQTDNPVINPDFLANLILELGEKLKTDGKKLLSVILLQSKFVYQEPILTLQIPQGFKNDTFESELLEIKRFVASKLENVNYEFEVEEIKKEFVNEIPHTLEERKNALIQENPEIAEWIQTLGLHFN